MKPAKEWIRMMPGRGDHAIVTAADILARDIEVLKEVAKLVCSECERGDKVSATVEQPHSWAHWYWNSDAGAREGVECEATGIHDRILVLNKELADAKG